MKNSWERRCGGGEGRLGVLRVRGKGNDEWDGKCMCRNEGDGV